MIPDKDTIHVAVNNTLLQLNDWSFDQLCKLVKAPAHYIGKLTPGLASINLNYGLRQRKDPVHFLTMGKQIRSINGRHYKRIWNADLLDHPALTSMPGFVPWKHAKNSRVCSVTLLNENPTQVGEEYLNQGLRIMNSEVGASSVKISLFWYRSKCENGLIFGTRGRHNTHLRHVGKQLLRKVNNEIDRMIASNLDYDEITRMQNAMRKGLFLTDGEKALSYVMSKVPQIRSEKEAKAILEHALREEGGFNTPWKIANGITAYGRTQKNVEDRVRYEEIAGRYLMRAA